jgi:hypothetical protein
MTCPDIYIAPSHWTTPHTPNYGNTAIDVGPMGTTFTQDEPRTIRVTVRNHGTDNSPDSHLELHWADPSSSFALQGMIGDANDSVDGGDGIANDGEWPVDFSWTPGSDVVATNGGHVCLLAQVANNTSPGGKCSLQGHEPPSAAATDARSAIRNIHVVAPPMIKKAQLPGGKENGMNFAFAATDAAANRGETRMEIRALHPSKDREQLELLAADPAVHHVLAFRRAKFAVPEDVLVAEGTERVVLPRPRVVLRKRKELRRMPRIGHLGSLANKVAARLLPYGTKVAAAKKPLGLNLVPGEMRQMIVHVVPGKSEAIYAVAVDHVGAKDQPIGGLVMIFVPPPDLF